MKKKSVAILALLLIIFSACTQTKLFAHRSKKSKKQNNVIHLSYLKMQRTGCFGRCPTYNVEIFDNGLVRFTGIRFVDSIGIFEKKIPSSLALLSSFEKYRVDTLKNTYENKIVDLPGIVYSFTINKKTNQINNAHFGPTFLKQMANEIDGLIKIEGAIKVDNTWIKVSSGTKDE